ncbi:AAA family ATPase [Haliangium sp.]|uniref:AAA family ATPase n=1 Tax=Haliangium sp. TaxID=2663208 RepID=UPI003D0A29ED
MLYLVDHELRERIYESRRTVVYRGRRREDNSDVIVKTHRQERPPAATIARLRREYEMGSMVAGPGVSRYIALEAQGGSVAVVSEDFGGVDLRSQLPSLRGNVQSFLGMAVQLAQGLSAIHDQDLIHKDVKPGNIVVNPESKVVKFIDFGLASECVHERRGPIGPARMEGSIAYMSPEQTGRMNRMIDQRADLYSLGMTFYEMLCGQRPFPGDDPLELIHSHIAKLPTPPHLVEPTIPRLLSDLVMKLVAKNAEARYQTARGLGTDLLRCQQSMRETGRVPDFELGAEDWSKTLQVSQRLYGRESHERHLLEAFERASEGGRELMLVGGPAGVGKSSLIAEVHRPMTETRGYFISGKGDVLGGNVPYSVLVQALSALLKELLTESESRLEYWRGRLVQALGANAGLITEVLPELEHIIGEQPTPAPVGPAEARRRFEQTFLGFMSVFAGAEHPLVMFLDDLQWSDSGTLWLLRQLLMVSDCTHLLIVGAYRDDDVGRAHALRSIAAEIREAGGVVNETVLDPLGIDDVTRLVADTLSCEAERVRSLAALVHDKTLGNPFFVGELLRALHADDELRFDDGEWRWDEEQIRARGVSVNVVGLLVDKVRLLSGTAQEIVRLAACMGTVFTLSPLARVCGRSVAETARVLKEVMRVRLVQPVGDLYKQAELGMDEGAAAQYRFTHDRVQEAAYSLLPVEQRPTVHWQMGMLMLEDTPAEQQDARIFDIVNQLDQGMVLAKEQAERAWLARLNLRAGRRAAESMAHHSALAYLRNGIELLGDDGFAHEHELAVALHTDACTAAQASDDLAAMNRYADLVLANASSLLEGLPVYETRIEAHIAKGELVQALELGAELLGLLGIRLPIEPGPADVQAALTNIRRTLAERGFEELVALPHMEDPTKLAAMRIMRVLLTPIYAVKPLLGAWQAAEMIRLTLEYGNAPESSLGYASYGIMCCSGGSVDYEGAQFFGRLALVLVDRFDAQHIRPLVMVLVYSIIKPNVAHWASMCAPLREAARQALSNGNLAYGGNALYAYLMFSFAAGVELPALEQEVATHIEALTPMGEPTYLNWMNIHRQAMRNLLGYDGDPTRLQGAAYDEREMLSANTPEKDTISAFGRRLSGMLLSYLFRDYERALERADENAAAVATAPGFLSVSLFYCYDALIRLAVVDGAPEKERTRLLEQVTADQTRLRMLADAAPMNHRHNLLLVEAERHRVEGRIIEAIDAYDASIAAATSNGFHNLAALANERAAEFWLGRNKIEIATAYARAARYEYERWGAKAKVADLDDRYQGLATYPRPSLEASASAESVSSDSSTSMGAPNLDMGSVFKATRVLSEEMDVRKVVTSLMKIVIENAGAHRGVLLLDEGGALTIQASGSIADDEVVVSRSEASAAVDQVLSEAIVRYVVRTGTPLVLQDAVNSGMFTRDPHVRRTGVRSVLCMPFSAPMVSQHSAVGVLYLENEETVNAFSQERVRVLRLITAQAAISLENARLYGDLKKINATLEELVAERTKELRDAQRALVRASRKVGQAEVAENLLHNAGNLLNSLTVSAGILRDAVRQPTAQVLNQLVERLRSPEHELSDVFANNQQGALVLKLLGSVGEALTARERELEEISGSIGSVVEEFVQMLQRHDEYLTEATLVQAFLLGTLLDDAIASAGVGQRSRLTLRKDYGRQPLVHNDQYGLERLVVTLLRYAMGVAATVPDEPATLIVASHWTGREVEVIIGLGETSDQRVANAELFQQQSSSRGDISTLHDCANTAAKLGGTLQGYVGNTARDMHFVLTLGIGAPRAAESSAR